MAAVAVGIIAAVSSCKKEEVKPVTTGVTQQDPVDWVTKSGDWVIVEKDVNVNGTICDRYQNTETGQEVLMKKYSLNKKNEIKCDMSLSIEMDNTDPNGHNGASKSVIKCQGSGKSCTTRSCDGNTYLIICQN